MSILGSLIPLLLVPLFHALLIKSAAFLVRRTRLDWKNALIFSVIALLVGAIGTITNRATGQILPPILLGLLGVAVQLALGGWYLGPRAQTTAGGAIGFARGALISFIPFAVAFVIGIAAAFLSP